MAISSDKLLNRPSELHRRYGGRLAMQKAQQEKMVGGGPVSIIFTKKSIKNIELIKDNVVKIEGILKGTIAAEKKALDEKKKKESSQRREKQEEKLETKPDMSMGSIKMPRLPRMGILDWIKNFIGKIILGYFAYRLIEHLPKIIPIVKFIGNATDFIIDVGGKLLNGLATFIDRGYKAYDATRGFIKNIGGENFAQGFDKFVGAIDTALFLTTVLATDLAAEAMFGGGGGGDPTRGKPRPGQGGRPRVTTSGGGGAGRPDIRNPLRQKPTVTTGKGGKPGGFRLPGTGPRVTGSGGGPKIKPPKGIKARGGLLGLVFLIPDLIDAGMLVSQGRGKDGLRTLLSAVSGVVAGMAAYSATLAGAAALGITGVGLPAAIGLAVAGLAASNAAGYAAYNLADAGLKKMGLIDKDPKTGTPYAYRRGGITRGGKSQGGVKRTIKKGKYKRVLAPKKPSETKFETKDKNVKEVSENLDRTKYFGPILSVSAKILENQKPTQKDYENVGLGLNLLISKGIEEKQLKGGLVAAFAEGGMVDDDFLEASEKGGDISNWVTETFKNLFETKVEKNLRMIKEMKEMKKEKAPGESPSDGGELETAGGAVSASELYKEIGANLEQWDIYRNSIALIESGGRYGVPGGSGKHYDGRYQMGEAAKKDGSKVAGVPYPGHSSDPNAHVRVSFRNNPQLQETIFTGFTLANHRYLMRNPKYKSASVERKLEILGYAHNQGMGGAENWMNTGVVGADGFGTKGTKYTDLIAKNFRAKRSGGKMELAQGAVDISKEEVGPTSATLKGKYGLLSLGGSNAPGGDRTLTSSSTFSNTHLHHNKPDSDPYNRGPNRINKIPRDYVITRGDQSKDRGAPVPSGVGGKVVHASGHTVVVQDGGKDRVQFHHFDKIRARVGQSVSPNTILGTQGNTGTGAVHVHLDASASDHTRWIQGITKSAFHGENFGVVPRDGFMLRLHKGEVFKVIDRDSVDLLGFDLTKEIIDIENRSQLIAKAPSIIEKLKAISGYTDYEQPYAEPEYIEVPVPMPFSDGGDYFSGGFSMLMGGGGEEDGSFNELYVGG